ncbi:Hypothetical_protein [Hexamita inflata]|uniref:Hypothetical_protein n=1 Tax=Hexamita inflata TaxID=28002 RepID=A0AA86VBV6_9EUKA|nr:Hypothetical protein HINF_LOCUS49908 [Hexamita inflata]
MNYVIYIFLVTAQTDCIESFMPRNQEFAKTNKLRRNTGLHVKHQNQTKLVTIYEKASVIHIQPGPFDQFELSKSNEQKIPCGNKQQLLLKLHELNVHLLSEIQYCQQLMQQADVIESNIEAIKRNYVQIGNIQHKQQLKKQYSMHSLLKIQK